MSMLTVENITFVTHSENPFVDAPSQAPLNRYELQTSAYRHTSRPVLSLGVQVKGQEPIFWGDCISSPTGGAEAWTTREDWEQALQQISLCLGGKAFHSLRQTQAPLSTLPWQPIRFALSQALLNAFAHEQKRSQWEILAGDWDLDPHKGDLPFHGSSGGSGSESLTHFLQARFPSLPAGNGEEAPLQADAALLQRIEWLKEQITALGDANYLPVFHFDFHGGLGDQFGEDFTGLCRYLLKVEEACKPFPLRVEGPFLARDLLNQIHLFARLREVLESKGAQLELIADEWVHTLGDLTQWLSHGAAHGLHLKLPSLGSLQDAYEAVQNCRGADTLTFLGGNQTESLVRTGVHVGLALEPDFFVLEPSPQLPNPLKWVSEEIQRSGNLPGSFHPQALPTPLHNLARMLEALKNGG